MSDFNAYDPKRLSEIDTELAKAKAQVKYWEAVRRAYLKLTALVKDGPEAKS